uniref:Peptidase S1 domain-containing protein n=1 Tax=Globodera rostochiensis TaxID=31243 RepID=A0A914H063_GLORO
MLKYCRFLSFLLFIPCLIGGSGAILAGESVEWAQHGFLAKILVRMRPKGDVKSCTGALVSASLVLTSGHCVVDRRNRNETEKREMMEFVVTLPGLPFDNHQKGAEKEKTPPFRSTAKLLATSGREWNETGGWALLRIVPRNTSKLCTTKRFSRLNFRQSPNGPSQINVKPMELSKSDAECQLIGFSTSEKAGDFVTEEKVFRLHLKEVAEPPMDDSFHHYRSRVYSDNFTACYDDVGAPLFCKLASSGEEEFQLGLFQSLTVPLEIVSQGMSNDIEQCRMASEMRFTLLADDRKLAEAIQGYTMAEFIEGYQNCK